MAKTDSITDIYLEKYMDTQVACSAFAIAKMNLDKSQSLLKMDKYNLLAVPLQIGYKRMVLLASLSKQEIAFFQRFKNTIGSISLEFNQPNRRGPLKLFVRTNIDSIAPMKDRENVGMIVLSLKTTPEDLILILGNYLEHLEELEAEYAAKTQPIANITPENSKLMGYNQYAVLIDNGKPRRIKVFRLAVNMLEHLEGPAAPQLGTGTAVSYQLFFQRFRFSVSGKIVESLRLPNGMLRTRASLLFSPELGDILRDFWPLDMSESIHSKA